MRRKQHILAPRPPRPGHDIALTDGDLQILILDTDHYREPVPELAEQFEKVFWIGLDEGNDRDTHATYMVYWWFASGPFHACLINSDMPTNLTDDKVFIHDHKLVFGIGHFVAALSLPDFDLQWVARVEDASCFAVYHVPSEECYITWGELDIARLTYDGKIVWLAGGKDIFTEKFEIHDTWIEAVDFNHERYRIDITTGKSEIIP